MDKKDILGQILTIEFKWNKFKRTRTRLQKLFSPDHEAWLSMRARERLIDELLTIVHRLHE